MLRINPKTSFRCRINNTPLKEENVKKDMEIIVPNYRRLKKHAVGVYMYTQVNRTRGLIKLCFTNLDQNKISTYTAIIVRHILECCYIVWSPRTVQDKQALEREQIIVVVLTNEDIHLTSMLKKRHRSIRNIHISKR